METRLKKYKKLRDEIKKENKEFDKDVIDTLLTSVNSIYSLINDLDERVTMIEDYLADEEDEEDLEDYLEEASNKEVYEESLEDLFKDLKATIDLIYRG